MSRSRSKGRVVRTLLAAALAAAGGRTALATPGAPIAIAHDEVGCLVADRHPQLDACLTPAGSVGRARVHFRAGGTGAWYAVDLKPEGRCFRALLPRPLPTTQAIDYYVDVVDRGFVESRKPERAPDVPFTARVVGAEAECKAAKVGAWVSRVSQPLVVSAARDGQAIASAALGAMSEAPIGFSAEGLALAPPPASGHHPSTATEGSGASGAGGSAVAGIGVTTLAIAGGAVVAAGVVVAAATGGDAGEGGSGGGGGDVDLTGNWAGPWTTTFSGGGIPATTCAYDVALAVRHSGGTFSGTGTSSGGQCGGAVPGGGVLGGGTGTFAGTAGGGRVAFTIPFGEPSCPPFQYVGSYTANAMSGTMSSSCTIEGLQITWSGTWSAARR